MWSKSYLHLKDVTRGQITYCHYIFPLEHLNSILSIPIDLITLIILLNAIKSAIKQCNLPLGMNRCMEAISKLCTLYPKIQPNPTFDIWLISSPMMLHAKQSQTDDEGQISDTYS